MELTSDNVTKVLLDCLFTEEETAGKTQAEMLDGAVTARGIMLNGAFHKGRLESHREDIVSMLAQLPEQFHEGGGGGWSFLQACMTRDGQQWGEHRNMDELFVLGMAIGRAKCQFPRDMWTMLPGGMPYYCVTAEPAAQPGRGEGGA